MNKLEQAARQALEALNKLDFYSDGNIRLHPYEDETEEAITALREALAEQATVSNGLCGGCAKKAADGWALYCVECWEKAEQKPVAWVGKGGFNECGEGQPLYAAPVRTKDLTDDEINDVMEPNMNLFEFARAVIAADREKNK